MTNVQSEESMLIRLFPEQVNERWDFLAPMIAAALPPMMKYSEPVMVEVLASIMKSEASVWVYQPGEAPLAMLVTTVWKDPVSKKSSVLIYAFYGLTDLQISDYKNILDTLATQARSEGHGEIIAFSSNESLASLLRRIGFRTDFRLLEFDLGGK